MQKRVTYFLRVYLFWIVFFVVSRILFLLYHADLVAPLTASDVMTIFWRGLRMDGAMAGYWSILTGLILMTSAVVNEKWLRVVDAVVVVGLLLISVTIVVADFELYTHWGFRMDTTPLFYAGKEGAASVGSFVWAKLISLYFSLFVVFLLLYFRRVAPHFQFEKISLRWAPVLLLMTGLLFIPIRSSFSVAPLNTGVVYFHRTNSFANHAGINVVWNFFKSVVSENSFRYPSSFVDPDEAQRTLSEMTTTNGDGATIVKDARPNVVLIILESFTSKVIGALGGLPDVTPNLNRIAKEGLLFNHIYASGDRTDKGIISILSSYPAQPQTSIIKYPNKTQSLPALPRIMLSLGYKTSFVYGGDIGFANMESYLTTAGFSHITEDDDFPSTLNASKWGVHDGYVFNRMLSECDTARSPFFKVLLTLSSHEPFDVPVKKTFVSGTDDASRFLNACHYTDSTLGDFISKARTTAWWQNTLIIITADHGHRFPDAEELKSKERFSIPLLFTGGAVNKQGIVSVIGSQTDIATTLLSQLNVGAKPFPFGKNLLAKDAKPFAVYVFNNGFGYVDPAGEHVYDFDYSNYLSPPASAEAQKRGEAYMQALFSDYNGR